MVASLLLCYLSGFIDTTVSNFNSPASAAFAGYRGYINPLITLAIMITGLIGFSRSILYLIGQLTGAEDLPPCQAPGPRPNQLSTTDFTTGSFTDSKKKSISLLFFLCSFQRLQQISIDQLDLQQCPSGFSHSIQ